jgi:hypothetical protein
MVGLVGLLWFYQMPVSQVYACSDMDLNPVEIQKQCKRLTQHQWWGAYYKGNNK